MMKRLLGIVALISVALLGYAQEKEFKIPTSNNGHLTMKVNKGETIKIEEDSAFVVSSKSFHAYRHLRDELLKYEALNDKNMQVIQGSLNKYLTLLKELDQTIKSIDNLNDEQLGPIIANLSDVNENLISDVKEIRELNDVIEEKIQELEKIEKKLQLYRWKNAWFKFADWIVAGAVGFAIGAIAM